MGKQNFSKIKLLKIWEMLKQDTDEQHPLTTNQIIEKLRSVGIECDRKTLYQDIKTLNAYGYEIIQRRGQHNNSYYVVDRNFDVPELRILIDAVQAASFITQKKTAEFIDKISALGGSNRAEILKKNIVEFNTAKITEIGNNKIQFTADIQISNMFFGWCCCFGKKMKIVAPNDLKNRLIYYLQILSTMYTTD